MDGKTLTRELRQALAEQSDSVYLDDKSSYDYIYEAAVATTMRTDCFTTSSTIATLASTTTYRLPYDFLKLYLKDSNGSFFIKYYNGTNYYFIYPDTYDNMVLANNTTTQSIPNSFAIIPYTPVSTVSGLAAINGATTGLGGKCLLTGSGSLANVYPGDTVQNPTDGSNGYVVLTDTASTVYTALFDGTNNDWSTSDIYTIAPQGRFALVLDPPPTTAGHIVTVYYIRKPDPVYALYESYQFAPHFKPIIIAYAAWRYKYRDREPNYGDAWYKTWDMGCRMYGTAFNDAIDRKGFKVSFIKK